jgi:hypothetical protein
MLHFSQLFSDYSPIALPPSRPSGGEAGIPVTALLDQKGDMLLGSGDSLRNSLAVILRRDKRCRRWWFWLYCLPNRNYQRVVGNRDW